MYGQFTENHTTMHIHTHQNFASLSHTWELSFRCDQCMSNTSGMITVRKSKCVHHSAEKNCCALQRKIAAVLRTVGQGKRNWATGST
mmetsp:Transcript_37056/g.75936  ORF Transcript_37056/g.75936 Transcript_37056/m.75936 type:complete len:87 (+) Transcript_37056:156-416(+)